MPISKKRKKRDRFDLPVPLSIAPMEARSSESLPTEAGWQFEPKWDGFRCIAFRSNENIELRAKSGKSLSRFFPEVVTAWASLPVKHFVVDGELVIPVEDVLSFDSLQMRLHPAESRIRKLSVATPALYVLFDCLVAGDNREMISEPLAARREALESFFYSLKSPTLLRLSPYTRSRAEAERWLKRTGGSVDGVVAKRIDQIYASGERAMEKVKLLRTADCVVGGFRYATKSREVGSLLLGLYNDEGKLDHVGFTSSIANADRKALTKKLQKLIGEPGFSGNAPGAPSRWSTERSTEWEPLKPKLIAEVQYDHVTGDRFRHGTKFLRWRPDKSPEQCTFEQLKPPGRPRKVIEEIIKGLPKSRSSSSSRSHSGELRVE
jgi:ATP-dependent DNA ligase